MSPQQSARRNGNGNDGNPRSTRVVKKLHPHQHGAQRWLRRFGDQLICVRYRDDLANQRRIVTVELHVDERALPRSAVLRAADATMVVVRIRPDEVTLAQRLIDHGAEWDARTRTWRITHDLAKALGCLHRILPPARVGATSTPRRLARSG